MLGISLLLSTVPGVLRPAGTSGHPTSGYTLSRTADGIELKLHFSRDNYPAHALVEVTATLSNLSHPDLAVEKSRQHFGLCSWPAITIVSVNHAGQEVEPPQAIPPPQLPCPFPGTLDLPVGQSFVERQMVVLWSPRLRATARLFEHVADGYQGFSFPGAAARFHLYAAPAPTISTRPVGSLTTARVSLPPGAHGPLYYRSWGGCAGGGAQTPPAAYYWTRLPTLRLSAYCSRWHLDVAALNMPVASVNVGA